MGLKTVKRAKHTVNQLIFTDAYFELFSKYSIVQIKKNLGHLISILR